MNKLSSKEYNKLVSNLAPPSPKLKNCLWAFTVGGGICGLAQLYFYWLQSLSIKPHICYTIVTITIIVLSAIFTGLGWFDKLAKHAGAGTLVPVSGFANAVVSPAIEFKTEGIVLGMCANMFKIAGPVIVYGTVASVVYGVIYLMLLKL